MLSKRIEEKINKVLEPLKFDGVKLIDIREDGVELEMELDMDVLNYKGGLHGGMIFTLCDICSGITMLSKGHKVTTLQGNINYIKEGWVGPIFAKSKIVHKGRTTSVIDVDVIDGNMEVIAKGTFTMFILENL